MRLFRKPEWHRAFDDAREALDAGDLRGAVDGYERLVALDDQNTNAWFNLGLAYKLQRDWPNSARCNRRAAELSPENLEASWNLGVAATALRDWPTARWAWRNIGVDPGSGDGPPSLQLGPSPIRLTTGEVVWGERIDPCRAVLANVPLPESGHRWGDIVLHDVQPRGERQMGGKMWGVFDELIRMEEGKFSTLECEVVIPGEGDCAELNLLFDDHDLGAEDWTSSVRWLCESCGLGSPHEHTGTSGVEPIWLTTRRYGFAGPEAEVRRRLSTWASDGGGRSFGSLRPVADASIGEGTDLPTSTGDPASP